MDRAKLGDRVRVEISRRPADGARAQAGCGEPMEFTVGSHEVIPGLSFGVIGMATGERKRVVIQPQDAFGIAQPRQIKEVSRERFPLGMHLHVGKRLTSIDPKSGRRLPMRIVELKPHTVIVDGNHQLAGKVIIVYVMLLSLDSTMDDAGPYARYGDETITATAAFEHEIAEDHRRFRQLQRELRVLFAAERPRGVSRSAIIDLLAEFRDQLATQFALEETFAYFEDLFDSLPRLCSQAEVLHRQHGMLFAEACQVAEGAAEVLRDRGTLAAFRTVAKSYRDFDGHFIAHEASESELITRAYYEDTGVGD